MRGERIQMVSSISPTPMKQLWEAWCNEVMLIIKLIVYDKSQNT